MEKPPFVRLPAQSYAGSLLQRSAHVSMVVLGLVALVFALQSGRFILAPLTLAVVIGLMFGPVANRLERFVPPAVSALLVLILFVLLVVTLVLGLAVPLSFWVERLPQLWNNLQFQLLALREPIESIRGLQEQIREITGGSNLTVSVDEGSPMQSLAAFAPALMAQILLFLAALYFFVATRHQTRVATLKLCVTRRLRWRMARVFRDVERLVSQYLLSITVINIGLGIAVTFVLHLVGVPSPALWGTLAALLNFVIYLGPAVMAVILFAVGLATYDTLWSSLIPPAAYLFVNMIEAQFVTPMVIGRRMTLNPFLVFLALSFWIWIWGPLGGFIAIPALLVALAVLRNIFPWMQPVTQKA